MCAFLTKHEVKMTGYWPCPSLCTFTDSHKVKVNKNAKQAWPIKDLSYSKNILLYYKSRVTNLFEEPGKKGNCVCSTMHPQELFMISILTTSATFCNSIADIVQKL